MELPVNGFKLCLPCSLVLLAILSCTTENRATTLKPIARGAASGTLPETLVVSGSLTLDPALVSTGSASAENRPIQLIDDAGDVVAEGTTSPTGGFQLSLNPGQMSLTESSSSGISQGIFYVKSLFLANEGALPRAAGVRNSVVLSPSGISTVGGKATLDTGVHTARKVSAIVGTVTLESGESPVGIDVYVPGTTFMAKTNAMGEFILGFLPAGNYLVRADKSGYGSLEWQQVAVKRNETTPVGEGVMRVSTGPAVGRFALSEGDGIAYSPAVELSITLRGATKFRVSQLSDFRDTIFRPVDVRAESMTVPFQISGADGLQRIHLEAADSDGLSATAVLDVLLDTKTPAAPMFRVKTAAARDGYAASRQAQLFVSACDDVEKVFLTESAAVVPRAGDFSLECAVAASTGVTVSLSESEGEKNLYLWARDAAGQVSTAARVGQVVLDTVPPHLTVLPASGVYSEAVALSATAGGAMNLHYTLDLSEPTATSPLLSESSSLVLVSGGTVKIMAIDLAGNASAVVTRSYTVDRDGPILGSALLNSAKTKINSIDIPLILSAQGATQMKFALTPAGLTSTGGWVSFQSAPYSFSLPADARSDGPKVIYVGYRDDAGNTIGLNGEISVAFVLDRTSPVEGKITLLPPETPSGAFNMPLAWNSTYEEEEGLVYVVEVFSTSDYSGAPLRTMRTTATSTNVSPALSAEGVYYWRVQAEDAAGNRPNWWVNSGADKSFRVRILAQAYLSKRDASGDPATERAFARELIALPDLSSDGRPEAAFSILESNAIVDDIECIGCGVVKIQNPLTGATLATITEGLTREAGFGRRLVSCDLDDNGMDELVVAAPGKPYLVSGRKYFSAGAVYAYSLSQYRRIAAYENSPEPEGDNFGYTSCTSENVCGWGLWSDALDWVPGLDANVRYFGWDMACQRKSGADVLVVGEPGYRSGGATVGRVVRLSYNGTATLQLTSFAQGVEGEGFGTAVAAFANASVGGCPTGPTIAVGSPRKTVGGIESGYVQLFTDSGGAPCGSVNPPVQVGSGWNFGSRLFNIGNLDNDGGGVEELAIGTSYWSGGVVKILGSLSKTLKSETQGFGYRVAMSGDFDSTPDGQSELAVSAPQAQVLGQWGSGTLAIFKLSLLDDDASDNDTPFRSISGVPGMSAGTGASFIPVLTASANPHSATQSMLTSAPGRMIAGTWSVGALHNFAMVNLAPTLPSRIEGKASGAGLGASVAAVGDVDNDSVGDIVVGQPGARCDGVPTGVLSIFSVAAHQFVKDACPWAVSQYTQGLGTLIFPISSELIMGFGQGSRSFRKVSIYDLPRISPHATQNVNPTEYLDPAGSISEPRMVTVGMEGAGATLPTITQTEVLAGRPADNPWASNNGILHRYRLMNLNNGSPSPAYDCRYHSASSPGARFGAAATFIADLDGASNHGMSDLLVGAPGVVTGSTRGRVYGIHGQGPFSSSGNPLTWSKSWECSANALIDADNSSSQVFVLDANDARLGSQAARPGFGSTLADLGALDAQDASRRFFYVANTNIHAGSSSAVPEFFVFSWSSSTLTLSVIRREVGEAGSMLGSFVKVLGDVNGDGISDFAVSQPGGQGRLGLTGNVRIYSGAGILTADTHDDILQMLFNPDPSLSNFGISVAYADYTGDGIPDFLVGANKYDSAQFSDAGALYVFPMEAIRAE